MSGTFRPHREILPPAQRQIWPDLAALAPLGFVLYGGTAVALRLGHRQSVDFDFFNEQHLDLARLRERVSFLDDATVLHQDRQSWVGLVPVAEAGEVKLSIFGDIDFGRVGVPERTDDQILLVASLEDLMATKLKVLFERAQAKDYRDIAAMIRHGQSLSLGLASGQSLFGKSFQPSVCLKALCYFQGGDLAELQKSDRQTLVAAAAKVSALPSSQLISDHLS
jgi:hypothetical protein